MATAKKEKKEKVSEITEPQDARTALDTCIKTINKVFGEGSIMKLGENSKMQVSAISTGSLTLDLALGIGGLPRGRIVEIYGPESSGKTTLALHAVAEAQKLGGYTAYVDAEHALDPVYARNIGVDINELLVSQPDSGEQALEITEALARSGAIDVMVVDSVAALVPREEIDGDMGANHVGLHARLMSQAMRKLSAVISNSNCIVIFINQLREKVGVTYGNPEVTTGGRALKFYSSVRIDIRKSDVVKSGKDIIGNHVRCKVVKNKVAAPFKIAEFDIMYGKGINRTGEILDVAVLLEIAEKVGTWFYYNGNRLAQGRDNTIKFLDMHPEILSEIEKTIRDNKDNIQSILEEKKDNPIPDEDESAEESA